MAEGRFILNGCKYMSPPGIAGMNMVVGCEEHHGSYELHTKLILGHNGLTNIGYTLTLNHGLDSCAGCCQYFLQRLEELSSR